MDHSALVERLRRRCNQATQAEVADQLGISKQYLSDILAGRRDVGPKVLKILKLNRRVTYQPTNGS